MENRKKQLTSSTIGNVPKEAYGPSLIMYHIALEAWRRGITVEFYTTFYKKQIRIRYILSLGEKEYKFQLSLGDKVEKEARRIGKSKDLTKEALQNNHVSIPAGQVIKVKDDFSEAIEYAQSIGYPLVVKPTNSSLGRGVCTDIKSQEALIEALEYVCHNLGYKDVIVEGHIKGDDTRAYVVADQVVAAYKRVPAFVVGQEGKTIKELIEEKNEKRKRNPHASAYEIKINDQLIDFIKGQGYSLNSVLKTDEKVELSKSTLHPDGCETFDITDEITEEYKKVAIEAVKAIPGMNLCGVDIMMDQETNSHYVLELNSRPNIGGHIYPMHGQSRDVPRAIIDYYFPETRDMDREKHDYFVFDFDSMIKFAKRGIVKNMVLPSLAKNDLARKDIILKGKIKRYLNWIYRGSVGHKLAGQVEELGPDRAKLVIAGSRDDLDQFTEALFKKQSDKLQIEILGEDDWHSLVMYPFAEPILQEEPIKKSRPNLKEESQEVAKLKKEIEGYKKELWKLKNSRSWKITSPLRKLRKKL